MRFKKILAGSAEFESVVDWPESEPFVPRLLNDMLHRSHYKHLNFWHLLNDQDEVVGFGSLDVVNEYSQFTDLKYHTYIPLIVVHPDHRRKGYGEAIIEKLLDEASKIIEKNPNISEYLLLDVYEDSVGEIKLYKRNGFIRLNDIPYQDEEDGNKNYFVMARSVKKSHKFHWVD